MKGRFSPSSRKISVNGVKEQDLLVQEDDELQNNEYQNIIVGATGRITSSYGSKYRLSKSVNVRAVQNSLDNIFSWIPGERIINPEFGTRLHEYLYEGITTYNEELIVAEIKMCVARWEPRVVITRVVNMSTLSETEDNTIVLDIKYYIKGLPDRIFDKQYIFNRSM
jgi:phage baseplate assembly protein W